ncbi:MAG: 3-isopropylmalate dehydratase large subunit [Elusimicrobiota bacterium]|jgi:3-isopropylmalate/(R)-2-methylmalate dehydratase large subunit|nr:3-isopropylmalate dehydratase large subunit [Elusimicrobiota bacterium]
MGQTITEKILADKCGKKIVKAGEFIEPQPDIILANDVTAPSAIKEFKKLGVPKVFNKDKIVFVMDHFATGAAESAEQLKIVREFAKEQDIFHYYEGGNAGIAHILLPQQHIVLPGFAAIGADSHTCAYGAVGAFSTGIGAADAAAAMAEGKLWMKVPQSIRFILKGTKNKWVSGKDIILYIIGEIGVDGALYASMEFEGPICKELSMSERLTICNMTVEAGAKNGIFAPDSITKKYIPRSKKYKIYSSDKNADYYQTYEIDCSKIYPQVSLPYSPANTRNVKTLKKIFIDQVVIGSCANGSIEDLRIAAQIIKKGKKINPNVRMIIIPSTPKIYAAALKEGLIEIFTSAGASVSEPFCGVCLGNSMGALASGEKCLATTSRNFVGRMGHPKSEVYLSSPATAAASAIKGYISEADEI